MTNGTDDMVMPMLRQIQAGVGQIGADMQDVKQRLTSLELGFARLTQEVGRLHEDFANQSARIVRIDQRLDRIERRLDLADAPAE